VEKLTSNHAECQRTPIATPGLPQRVRDISSGGSHTLLQRWKILDRHFLKPLFGGRQFSAAAVRGYPLVAPDGGIEEEDDEDDSETPRPGGTPTWCVA
jgi:hypothetical protein